MIPSRLYMLLNLLLHSSNGASTSYGFSQVVLSPQPELEADNIRGTFQHPSAAIRPRFRYWLPDASVDGDVVKTDILSAAAIGAGGVELVPYYNYGGLASGNPPPAGLNWSTYGFGTPAFKGIFRAALEAHKESGTKMDFAQGPNQGQGVPAKENDEGLQWDLVPFSITITNSGNNGTFEGTIPGWGTGQLVALVSALILEESEILQTEEPTSAKQNSQQYIHVQGLPETTLTTTELVIDAESLQDITSRVSPSGDVSLSFPVASPGQSYRLFAFYQRRTLAKNLSFESERHSTIWDDGCYIVDHFSARGAEVVTDFWDTYMLDDGLEELLEEVGNYGWEDSVEIMTTITWTPSLPTRFREKFGYRLEPYLPFMIFKENNLSSQRYDPGSFKCTTNTTDQGTGYINDYRSAIQDGYIEYIEVLNRWTNNRLGKKYSNQPSYNLPMDMTSSVPYVDIPECESLAFFSSIDAYRQFTGSATLSRKSLISNEMGAAGLKTYSHNLADLLGSVNNAVAGGVNQFVLHGQTFSGYYPETTWPGYTPFSYTFSEMYSPKQPSWDHSLPDLLDYIARIQFIQQLGVPLTDVAIYNKPSHTDPMLSTIYEATDLKDMGYSYSYLSPENFNLPHAYAELGTLAPLTPAWKAIVIESKQKLTADAIGRIQGFAAAGVPIIVSGGHPGCYYSGNKTADNLFSKALADLLSMENIYQVRNEEVAAKLIDIGIRPRTAYSANGTWYTTWRQDTASMTDYIWILNDYPELTVGELVVNSAKSPYFLNLWTGERTPVLAYYLANGTTTIPLSLEGGQVILIAFEEFQTDDPACHVTYTDADVLGAVHSAANKSISLHTTSTTLRAEISNGQSQVMLSGIEYQPVELENWTLVVEHWEKPDNIFDASVVAVKRNTTHQLNSLISWLDIPALVDVSGLGYYTVNFTWSSDSASGAYISLPAVQHGARVSINGVRIPPLDIRGTRRDITSLLKEGINEVLVVVPTTMWNYLKSFFDEIQTPGLDGVRDQIAGLPAVDNGLIGSVLIIPFQEMVIDC